MSVPSVIFVCVIVFIGAYALGNSKGWEDGFNHAECLYKSSLFKEDDKEK